jgi:branched-chain amino acid transport system substrate-binding protein
MPEGQQMSIKPPSSQRAIRSWKALLLLLFSIYLIGCWSRNGVQPGRQKVVFGAILPMTGGSAQYGEEARQGIDIAIEQLKASGATDNYDFSYELQDSASDPKNAESTLRTLQARNNMLAVISEVSGIVLALAPICEREQIVLMNMGAQNPKIGGSGRFIFSNVNLADVESKQLAEFTYNTLGKRRAAVLYAAASSGQGARDVFVPTFTALGGQIVAETSYPVESTDYKAQISEISRANPDVVYLPGTTQDMARVLRQSYEMGFRPQWLSYTAFEGQEILSLAGNAAEGVIFASAYLDWDNATGVQAQFRDIYKSKYQKLPSVFAANAYDAVLMLANAVRAKGASGVAVRDYLASMPPFAGASGQTQFDAKGTVNKPLVFKTVKNGAFVQYERAKAMNQ